MSKRAFGITLRLQLSLCRNLTRFFSSSWSRMGNWMAKFCALVSQLAGYWARSNKVKAHLFPRERRILSHSSSELKYSAFAPSSAAAAARSSTNGKQMLVSHIKSLFCLRNEISCTFHPSLAATSSAHDIIRSIGFCKKHLQT